MSHDHGSSFGLNDSGLFDRRSLLKIGAAAAGAAAAAEHLQPGGRGALAPLGAGAVAGGADGPGAEGRGRRRR